MAKVFLKTASYQYKELKPLIFEMIDAVDPQLIKPRSRVLVKPNLLLPAPPKAAITTHPFVVRAVTEYVLSKGGQPLVADSPAMGSFEKIGREGGFYQVLEGLDVEFKAFKTSVHVDIGEPFGHIELAQEALEADVVINLPKLKTHTGMLLTLGVKNMFGCVVGLRKPRWHLRCGVDRDMFARVLVQIYQAVNPSLTLVDGIWALEGQGPGRGGTMRQMGLLAAGADAHFVDMTICKILGLDPYQLPTYKAARDLGAAGDGGYIRGDLNIIDNFKFPEITPLTVGPKLLNRMMRKHLLQRPVANTRLCRMCGECWQYCPSKSISQDGKAIAFDYDACIRCYCCIEICPHGALRAAETVPGKVLRYLKVLK